MRQAVSPRADNVIYRGFLAIAVVHVRTPLAVIGKPEAMQKPPP